METTYTIKQKESILKWRQNNLDAYREYQRKYAFEHYDDIKEKKKQYYEENKEKKRQYYLRRKQYKIDLKEFMGILLE